MKGKKFDVIPIPVYFFELKMIAMRQIALVRNMIRDLKHIFFVSVN